MIVFEQFNIRAREGIAQAVADIQRQLIALTTRPVAAVAEREKGDRRVP